MPGGEFRFGTASIYMAQRANIQPNRTSQMRVITWTRFRRPQRHFLSTSAAFIVSARGKLGLALLWQFKGTFRGISVGYEFRIGKAKRRRYLWKRKNCQSSARAWTCPSRWAPDTAWSIRDRA